ncbi:MAG TPA: nucleotide-binding protein [Verrucomicrobiota bacterium]|nr:nucleotide-binding protein [Verrucomicrobiota bacterium]
MKQQHAIFVVSSTEGRPEAEIVAELLSEGANTDVVVLPWWRKDLFPANKTVIECLDAALSLSNAALVVATEDDRTNFRKELLATPRDNVLFEYGMWSGAHGRNRVAIAIVGTPKLPSDLLGLVTLHLPKIDRSTRGWRDDTREKYRSAIQDWRGQLCHDVPKEWTRASTLMAETYKALELAANDLAKLDAAQQRALDVISARLLRETRQALLGDNTWIKPDLIHEIEINYLNDCTGIYAIDAGGPQMWVGPDAFRYLALQMRSYQRANTRTEGFTLHVGELVGSAIKKAIENAKQGRLRSSLTQFDNPELLDWKLAELRLEYARVLLWTEEELQSSIADAVVAIHEAFNVPLFFIETDASNQERDSEYILFSRPNQKGAAGLYGVRPAYETETIKSQIAGLGDPGEHFARLLNHESIMFAVDARELVRRR